MKTSQNIMVSKELSGKTKIWRYQSLEQFLALITSSKLHLSKIIRLTDAFEGTLPDEMKFGGTFVPPGGKSNRFKKQREQCKADKAEILDAIEKAKNYFVNCWTQDNTESYALWKIYANTQSGISIQSTIESLKNSIKESTEIKISKISYDKALKESDIPEHIVTRKKEFYRFENEIRLFLSSEADRVYLTVDLDILINNIYFAPAMPEYLKDSIKILINMHNPNLISKIKDSVIKFKME